MCEQLQSLVKAKSVGGIAWRFEVSFRPFSEVSLFNVVQNLKLCSLRNDCSKFDVDGPIEIKL